MKRIIAVIIGLLPLCAQGLERDKLNQLLATAAGATSNAYREARQAILQNGKDILPKLMITANDQQLTWQQRLVARICYERIVRADEVEEWKQHDWMKDPEFDSAYLKPIVGPAYPMGKLVVSRSRKMGLWYHFVEIHWKNTHEYSIPRPQSAYWQDAWTHHLVAILEDQPERWYLARAMMERLEQDPTLRRMETIPNAYFSVGAYYYKYLLQHKDPDAVPILVERLEAYVRRTRPNTLSPEELEKVAGWELEKDILPFADSRHADVIERSIAEHPALAPLKYKVAEIRKRPAPAPRVEPPFRLGTTLIKP